jgi:hypothetical protein
MILSCLGIEITCVARGEIGLNPQFDAEQIDDDVAEYYKDNLDPLSYFNIGTDPLLPQEITSDDVVDLSAQDPGSKNNSSLAWTIVFGKFTYFTAGDLEHEAESNVIWGATSLLNRHMCAWKLSHHGSHHATRPGFLASALPRFGVASCGHQNKHGHPGRAVIPRIQDLNKTYACTVYVTGDVKSDPSNYGVPDNNCVFGNQGNVVITVTSTDANKDSHAFTVTTRSGAGSFQCGDRSTSRPKIGDHKDLMAEQDINKKRRRAASQGHQRVRAKYFEDTARDWLYQKVGDILGYSVHDKAKIDAWLKAHDMEASFANVVDFLRQSFKQHYNPDTADADDMAVVQGDLHKSYEGCTVARNFLKKISDLQ